MWFSSLTCSSAHVRGIARPAWCTRYSNPRNLRAVGGARARHLARARVDDEVAGLHARGARRAAPRRRSAPKAREQLVERERLSEVSSVPAADPARVRGTWSRAVTITTATRQP